MSLCHSGHQCPLDCTLKYVGRNSNEVLLRGMLCTSPVTDHIYHKFKSSASNEVYQTQCFQQQTHEKVKEN